MNINEIAKAIKAAVGKFDLLDAAAAMKGGEALENATADKVAKMSLDDFTTLNSHMPSAFRTALAAVLRQDQKSWRLATSVVQDAAEKSGLTGKVADEYIIPLLGGMVDGLIRLLEKNEDVSVNDLILQIEAKAAAREGARKTTESRSGDSTNAPISVSGRSADITKTFVEMMEDPEIRYAHQMYKVFRDARRSDAINWPPRFAELDTAIMNALRVHPELLKLLVHVHANEQKLEAMRELIKQLQAKRDLYRAKRAELLAMDTTPADAPAVKDKDKDKDKAKLDAREEERQKIDRARKSALTAYRNKREELRKMMSPFETFFDGVVAYTDPGMTKDVLESIQAFMDDHFTDEERVWLDDLKTKTVDAVDEVKDAVKETGGSLKRSTLAFLWLVLLAVVIASSYLLSSAVMMELYKSYTYEIGYLQKLRNPTVEHAARHAYLIGEREVNAWISLVFWGITQGLAWVFMMVMSFRIFSKKKEDGAKKKEKNMAIGLGWMFAFLGTFILVGIPAIGVSLVVVEVVVRVTLNRPVSMSPVGVHIPAILAGVAFIAGLAGWLGFNVMQSGFSVMQQAVYWALKPKSRPGMLIRVVDMVGVSLFNQNSGWMVDSWQAAKESAAYTASRVIIRVGNIFFIIVTLGTLVVLASAAIGPVRPAYGVAGALIMVVPVVLANHWKDSIASIDPMFSARAQKRALSALFTGAIMALVIMGAWILLQLPRYM